MYTHDQILELISVAKAAKLSFPDEFAAAPLDELCEVCNGMGSASMSEKLRKALTKAYACAQVTAAIHDWRYAKSDGTEEKRLEADKQILNSAFGEYLPMSISLEIENILNT